MKENKDAHITDTIIKNYSLWALGAGLIPIPFLDLGAIAAVQLKMLYDLSKHYHVQFSKTRLKSIIAASIGTITTDSLRSSTFTRFIKSIPVVGVIASLSTPIYAAAVTYAIGKVFVYHFEAGGTSDDFSLEKIKTRFKDLFQEGTEMFESQIV